MSDWLQIDLMSTHQCFSYIMARTRQFLMRCWWGPLDNTLSWIFYSASSLNQQSVGGHVAPRGHISVVVTPFNWLAAILYFKLYSELRHLIWCLFKAWLYIIVKYILPKLRILLDCINIVWNFSIEVIFILKQLLIDLLQSIAFI